MPTVDDAAVQRAVEEVAAAVAHQETEPQMNHARAHEFGHGEAVREFFAKAHLRQSPFNHFLYRVFQFVVRFTEQVDVKEETSTSRWALRVLL